MESKQHKFISVTYEMSVIEDGKKVVKDSADESNPYELVSGLGHTLPALEEALVKLGVGDTFEVTVPMDQAFGEHDDDLVVELARGQFEINGKLNVELGQVVPLRDEHGKMYNATVQEINGKVIVLDLNHPFAGHDLMFEGKVLSTREATDEELNAYLSMLAGGCGCGHGGCGCDDDGCSSGCHSGCGC